jgi:hypothetical protein
MTSLPRLIGPDTGSPLRVKRIEVWSELLAGRRMVESGAAVRGLAWRQTFRLLARYKELGGASLIHQAPGPASNRQMNPCARQCPVPLVRTEYADFGPTLAIEARADLKRDTTSGEVSSNVPKV